MILFRETGVVRRITYSFSYFIFTCFIYSFYSWYEMKGMLYPVKQLNHIFIKITQSLALSQLHRSRTWLLSHWTTNVRCPLLMFPCLNPSLYNPSYPSPVVPEHTLTKSYVYWTMHHLDSWIKRDQLDVTCFIISLFIAQHVSDVNASILKNLRLICWVISWVVLLWFDACWCYVVVWLGWCGIRMQAEAPEDVCINIRNMLSIK